MHLRPTRKGDIAESAVIAELTRLGHRISLPFAGDCPYDIVLDDGEELRRVQVKHGRTDGERVRVSLKRTNPNHNEYNDSYYTADEVDAFAIYASALEESFWIPFEEAPDSEVTLRYAGESDHPATRWAEEYRLPDALETRGGE